MAKDPSNLSLPYHKQVTITAATQTVKVMPENTLYWYGYNDGIETCSNTNGWSNVSRSWANPSAYNENNIYLNSSEGTNQGVGNKNNISSANKMHAILMSTLISSGYGLQIIGGTKSSLDGSNALYTQTVTNTTEHAEVLLTSQENISVISMNGYRTGYLYALWYE